MLPPPRILDTEYPDELHYVPAGDLREHEAEGTCWCCPTRREHGWRFIWTHHPADGREYYDDNPLWLQ